MLRLLISFPSHSTHFLDTFNFNPCCSLPAGVNFVKLANMPDDLPSLFLTWFCFDLFCFSVEELEQDWQRKPDTFCNLKSADC